MSDRDAEDTVFQKTVRKLETFQARQYKARGHAAPMHEPDTPVAAFREEVERLMASHGLDISQHDLFCHLVTEDENLAGSRHDPQIIRFLLAWYGARSRAVLASISPEFPKPVYGTYPFTGIGALVSPPRRDEMWLVLLSSGMFLNARDFAQAVALAMPYDCEALCCVPVEHLASMKHGNFMRSYHAHHGFLQTALNVITGGKIRLEKNPQSQSLEMTDGAWRFAAALLDGANLFAIGHEFGHIRHAMGDISYQPMGRFMHESLDDPDAIQFINSALDNHPGEILADQDGVGVLVSAIAAEGGTPEVGYVGAAFFFGMCDFLDRLVSVIHTGQWDEKAAITSSTHPPVLTRLEMTDKEVWRLLKDKHQAARAIASAHLVGEIFEVMWRLSEPSARMWHENGFGHELLPEFREVPNKPGSTTFYSKPPSENGRR